MSGLCVFGGAFDPPHRTHRRIVAAALEQLRPARLLVVPCADHAFKGRTRAPAEHRLQMAARAFASLLGVEISRLEIDRAGVSYAVDTVRQLRSEVGMETPLHLLIGSDNLDDLDHWREHGSLLELATPVVFPRQGFPVTERALRDVEIRLKHKQALLKHVLDVPADDVSSTAIRDALRSGETPPELDAAVLDYIREHRLYTQA